MDPSLTAHRELKPKLTAAAVFLSAAVSIACIFLTIWGMPRWDRPAEIAAAASPLVFLCACISIFFRPRLGYGLGLVAGLITVPWLVQIETAPATWNSWISFNWEGPVALFVKLKILSVALLAISIACSALRLLPLGWSLREYPLSRRTWPAFAFGLLVLSVWFFHSVTPYSVPAFDHPAGAELRILHLQKRGLRIHETRVTEFRNGEVFVVRDDRRLFLYQFEARVARSALADTSPTALEHTRTFVQSTELWKLHTPPPAALRSWNAEGWYIVLKESRLFAFTSENGRTPPLDVTNLFRELETLPASQGRPLVVRDVCLGFCYDPVAALGFSVLPARIRLLSGSQTGF